MERSTMKLSFVILCLICVNGLFAQPVEIDQFKRFGFQAGANFSNMNFNQGYMATTTHDAAAFKAGFTFGFLVRIHFITNFFLQPEYSFIQRNGADKSLAINYSLNYLSMPVLLTYKIIPAVAVLAGPQFELLISAKSKDNSGSIDITHDTEERSIGATAGIAVEIKKSIIISARYLEGFNHIGLGQRSNIKEFKYQAVTITAGIQF
jgi:hypothetical protein